MTATYVTAIYTAAALGFAFLGVLLSTPAAQIGGTRPDETIPSHLAELAAFGLLLGAPYVIALGRRALPLALASSAMTLVLDIDHLPAYLGYAQPIRPAHSLVFILVVSAIVAITIKAPGMNLIVLSAFLGHMAVDTGLIAPLSPLSFYYVQLDPYRLPFAAGAVLCAVAACLVLRLEKGKAIAGGQK